MLEQISACRARQIFLRSAGRAEHVQGNTTTTEKRS